MTGYGSDAHVIQYPLAVKIMNSPKLLEEPESWCGEVKIEPKKMIRDVPTQWNSTVEMLQHALQLALALKILIVKAEYNKTGCGVCLQRFQLSSEE